MAGIGDFKLFGDKNIMIMNKTLTFVTAITLTTGLIAGGNDRDMGPIEAFDSIIPAKTIDAVVPVKKPSDSLAPSQAFKSLDAATSVKKKVVKKAVKKVKAPVAEKVVITKHTPDVMMKGKKSDIVGKTPSGFEVTKEAHENCQATLSLSKSNIYKFQGALATGSLFNTGPTNSRGTLFSPERWADYFYCVRGQ
jgi:hypothetical protein